MKKFQFLFLFFFISIFLQSIECKSKSDLIKEGDELLSTNPNQAINTYNQAIKTDENDYYLYYKRSLAQLNLHKFRSFMSDISYSLSLNPTFSSGYFLRGRINLKLGRLDEAEADLKKSGMSAKTQLKSIKQAKKLITKYDKVLKSKPNEKTNEEKKKILDEILKLCPSFLKYLQERISISISTADLNSALFDLQTSLLTDRSDPKTHYLKGKVQGIINERQTAVESFKNCLKYDPDNKECKTEFFRTKKIMRKLEQVDRILEQNQYRKTIQLLTETIQLWDEQGRWSPESGAMMYQKRCRAYVGLSETDNALKDCESSLEIQDNYAEAWFWKGEAKIKAELWDEAINDFNKFQELDQNQSQRAQEAKRRAEIEKKKASRVNYYKVLEISEDATLPQIKRAYRTKAKKFHPDMVQGEENKKQAEKTFGKIAEAYEVLKDPEKRRKYDLGEDLLEQHNPFENFQNGGFTFNFGF
ncbi:hypothetical protein M0813_01364 [Anaeramoeba flamelloides]|uniref:J domain-containing protein n=1 Tax=Anaeramoeba flamelloides TaxID=1746091 RepID=A0AAV7YTC2_9EUKA|nr:hypothetical protein M0812_20845 [Anaeramoeba flamelloides]KAJ6253318.1 hypothetical protein M0813_01364 [Anaeramoeba flamelloides]|eukprot:Anaeramoba_flamelloidesa2782_105.p1 GENE.a2782_105~~a2782_105.p1  ORF type:complete len:473 (+),score=129.09 a2782_105:30-1448(+)